MRNTVRQGATRRGTATQSKRAARMRFQPYSPAEVGQAAQPVYMHIRQLAERLVECPRLGRMWQEPSGGRGPSARRSFRSQQWDIVGWTRGTNPGGRSVPTAGLSKTHNRR